jgi:hypothetical protein
MLVWACIRTKESCRRRHVAEVIGEPFELGHQARRKRRAGTAPQAASTAFANASAYATVLSPEVRPRADAFSIEAPAMSDLIPL